MVTRRTAAKKKAKPAARTRRAPIPDYVREEILRRCRRRCCMCFGLNGDLSVKEGQLAHLDRDRANPQIDNLAFLCQGCHTLYDTKNNRVQGFTSGEIRHYRDRLYAALGHDRIQWGLTITVDINQYDAAKDVVDRAHALLLEFTREVSRTEGPIES